MSNLAKNIISSLLPSPDKMTYAFEDELGIDMDDRYAREPIGAISSDNPSKSTFAILSSELHCPQYQVRTAEQQFNWTEKKSICQQQLAMEIFKFKTTWAKLINACNGKTEHLLGVIKKDSFGPKISYDLKLHKQVKKLAEDYLSGKCKYSRDELIKLIISDYNLSYCHFIKQTAEEAILKYKAVEKERKNALCINNRSNIADLFDKPSCVTIYENEEDINWEMARATILLCQTISTRITQLKNLLVTTNMRSCLKHAMNYYFGGGGSKQSSLDQLDLFSEGVEGLMHAADMFIHGVNAKFSTYSENWVRLKISRYIKNNFTVKVPIHVYDLVGKITKHIKLVADGNHENFIPRKEEVETALNERIPDSVWQLAMHKNSNTPYSISCVDGDSEEGDLSFDMFQEVSFTPLDAFNEIGSEQIKKAANNLLNSEKEGKYGRITALQHEIFFLNHSHERTFKEIEDIMMGKGIKITAKQARKEAQKVSEAIRSELKIKD